MQCYIRIHHNQIQFEEGRLLTQNYSLRNTTILKKYLEIKICAKQNLETI